MYKNNKLNFLTPDNNKISLSFLILVNIDIVNYFFLFKLSTIDKSINNCTSST
jgi:hypothetical protein